MIAIPRQTIVSQAADWHAGFLEMLPTLERYARIRLSSTVERGQRRCHLRSDRQLPVRRIAASTNGMNCTVPLRPS